MPAKKLIVVHGYPLTKDGGLGANKVVLDKVLTLLEKYPDAHIVLSAAINEDTGEGKPFIFQLQEAYLREKGVQPDIIHFTLDQLSSDTWTEVCIAAAFCRDLRAITFEVHAVGFFPHSLKMIGCWRRVKKYFPSLFRFCGSIRVYHSFGSVGSAGDTLKVLMICFFSTVAGIYDIKGRFWPARQIKERRREKFTPRDFQDKVIF